DGEAARIDGHSLRVVAGARGHHPAAALLGRKQCQLVRRAALLEGAGPLQVLELEVDLGAAQQAEVPGTRAGSHFDVAADSLPGRDDVLVSDHEGRGDYPNRKQALPRPRAFGAGFGTLWEELAVPGGSGRTCQHPFRDLPCQGSGTAGGEKSCRTARATGSVSSTRRRPTGRRST